MLKSMTAFARHDQNTAWGTLTWELRTVNHRYLEPVFKLPDALRTLEPQCRDEIAKMLSRGKIDCQLRWQMAENNRSTLFFNRSLAEQIMAIGQQVSDLTRYDKPLSAIDIMRWPGVVSAGDPDLVSIQASVLEGLQLALLTLLETRQTEGTKIAAMLHTRIVAMHEQLEQLKKIRPLVLQRLREKWISRLQEIDISVDSSRLEQELVIAAQKLDIAEELDRLAAHLSELSAVLKRKEPVGRRLDFLMQELNREANTLSAKSQDVDTTRAGVEMKVLIEQMREQIQNIE